jgi:hypothetical protein
MAVKTSDTTLEKHITYSNTLDVVMGDNYPKLDYYIDMNSGPGRMTHPTMGIRLATSPIRFLKKLVNTNYVGNCKIYFCEHNDLDRAKLKRNIEDKRSPVGLNSDKFNIKFLPDHNYISMIPFNNNQRGLVFSDDNGVPNFQMLLSLSKFPMCDLFIHWQHVSVARAAGRGLCDDTLIWLNRFNRKYWYARDLGRKTMIYGSNTEYDLHDYECNHTSEGCELLKAINRKGVDVSHLRLIKAA